MEDLISKEELISETTNNICKLFNKAGTKMKKTLVIHPTDNSTVFLKKVYENHDFDVLNKFDGSKKDLIELMKSYDRIIMMGHGSSGGLFNVNHFYSDDNSFGYIIDESFVDVFKSKETISIWCHSDGFFKKYNLKGFHTGMVISEVGEELFVLGNVYLDENEILDNMYYYSELLGECINKEPNVMVKYMLENYNHDDEVTKYNRETLIVL